MYHAHIHKYAVVETHGVSHTQGNKPAREKFKWVELVQNATKWGKMDPPKVKKVVYFLNQIQYSYNEKLVKASFIF